MSRRTAGALAAVVGIAAALVLAPTPIPVAASAQLADTSGADCVDFTLYLNLGIEDIGLYDINEGWVYADDDPANRFKSVTGIAQRSKVSRVDFASNHNSHDQNVDILVDSPMQHLVSPINTDTTGDGTPDTIEVEWETGTFPNETQRNAPERYFPKWAWPNVGDRVWTNGHWVVDCGHPEAKNGVSYYRSEIHPPRAIASMRDQVGALPGAGQTPVRLTATDLYIHGNAGFVTETLACGQSVVLREDPDSCPVKTTPINDVYEFDIPLPPRPAAGATLAYEIFDGPGNSIGGVQPILTPMPPNNPTSRARIDLTGVGVVDTDVFAKKIYAGWIAPQPLRLLQLTMHRMDLEDDLEPDPGDCECTFFWMNLNRADGEWLRFSDHARGNMNDYDDWHYFGDGIMRFDGIAPTFYVVPGQDFTLRANGYDQDCFDLNLMDGSHDIDIGSTVDCYVGSGAYELEAGKNDAHPDFTATYGPPTYGVGYHETPAATKTLNVGGTTVTVTDGYELEYTIDELDVPSAATTSGLTLTQSCTPDGMIAVGSAASCEIKVANAGPGLPRNVVVVNDVTAASGGFSIGAASYNYPGLVPGARSCATPGATSFQCHIGTVPVGETATIRFGVTATSPGRFTSQAVVTSDATDPDATDNIGSDEITAVDLTLAPPSATNELGTPGQTHTVTATLDAGGPVANEPVAFDIVSGPNAGAAATVGTDLLGLAPFTYTAKQGLGGLGTDVIRGCITDDAGNNLCREVSADWVDTTPPVSSCPRGPNPSGVIAPPGSPGADNTASRFFKLDIVDAVDPSPSGFVVDTGSGTVFGPFPNGTAFKYSVRKNATPSKAPMTGEVDWHIVGTGEPAVYGVDSSGNKSVSVGCPSG